MINGRKQLTLVIIQDHPRILLGMKKRGFGAGRWNGFGGKVNKGESVEEAARRELLEEAGITVKKVDKRGILDFEFAANPGEILEVHIFHAGEFEGEPVESEEMRPEWFHFDEIPFAQMWPDDVHWFPLFLKGSKFKGRFLFGEGDIVLDHYLEEVSQF